MSEDEAIRLKVACQMLRLKMMHLDQSETASEDARYSEPAAAGPGEPAREEVGSRGERALRGGRAVERGCCAG